MPQSLHFGRSFLFSQYAQKQHLDSVCPQEALIYLLIIAIGRGYLVSVYLQIWWLSLIPEADNDLLFLINFAQATTIVPHLAKAFKSSYEKHAT